MARFRVKVNGLKELRSLIRKDSLLGEPLRAAFQDAAQIVEAEAINRAPRLTGKTAAAIYTAIDKRPVPRWGAVRVRTLSRASKKSGTRFRYPWALNYAKKVRGTNGPRRVYTYRGSGSPTYDWFTGAIRGAFSRLSAILDRAAREIERQWRT